jgi:hypothetical protein
MLSRMGGMPNISCEAMMSLGPVGVYTTSLTLPEPFLGRWAAITVDMRRAFVPSSTKAFSKSSEQSRRTVVMGHQRPRPVGLD